ncbi:MAG: hypothetical protein Q9182_007621 [Xanthomendoza sp. 2 TL-2023]
MRFTFTTLAFCSLVLPFASADPTLTIHNTKTRVICLKVETGAGYFPTSTVCGGAPGIKLAPMKTSTFHPSNDWIGAITPMFKSGPGTRFEINFSQPDSTWYNADMEMGMSGGTLGPSDNRKRPNGLPSLAGEQDPLAKANAAWAHVSDKAAFAGKYPQYMAMSSNQARLTRVYMDKKAPREVAIFFQLTAKFNAYITAGSIEGVERKAGSLEKMLEVAADMHSWFVDTQEMTMTIY